MAAPSYATDLATIILEMASTTGWTLISSGGGGANSLTAPETDDFIQGNNCISRNPWTSANTRGMVYNTAATVASGDAVYIWVKSDVTQALDSRANGGIQVVMGDTPTTLDCWFVDGYDTAVKGGWIVYAIDPTSTPSATVGGGAAGTLDEWGARWKVPTSGPSKGFPYKIDAIRHGREMRVTAGDATTPATWARLATEADLGSNRYGIVEGTDTGARVMGLVQWGTASASVYSRDSDQAIVLRDCLGFVSSTFTGIEINHASTDLIWTNISIQSLDSANRGTFVVNNNGTVTFDTCKFSDMGAFTDGGSNSTWDDSTFARCDAVTAAGGSFLNCLFDKSNVSGVGTSALVWNIATNPGTLLDGSTFVRDTAKTQHAIEFGTSSPTTLTLTGLTFTGYGADGTDNAAIEFKRTSGTVTVNYTGAKPTFLKPAGLTVTWVQSNTLTVTVDKDINSEIRVYDAGTTTAIAGVETIGATKTWSTAIDAATYPSVDVHCISLDYEIQRRTSFSMTGGDKQIDFVQRTDRQFKNP